MIITRVEPPKVAIDPKLGFLMPWKFSLPWHANALTRPPIECRGITIDGQYSDAHLTAIKLAVGNCIHFDINGVISIPPGQYADLLQHDDPISTIRNTMRKLPLLWGWGWEIRVDQNMMLEDISKILSPLKITLSESDRLIISRDTAPYVLKLAGGLAKEICYLPPQEVTLARAITILEDLCDEMTKHCSAEPIGSQADENERRQRQKQNRAELERLIRQAFPLPTTDQQLACLRVITNNTIETNEDE